MNEGPESMLDKIDAILGRAERITRLLVWLFCLIISGVLWGSRLEWVSADHEKRVTSLETQTKELVTDVTILKVRVPGITFRPPLKAPAQLLTAQHEAKPEREVSR